MMLRFESDYKFGALATRLASLLVGSPDEIFQSENTSRYQLGTANNWWLHHRGDKEFALHYRYGDSELMQAYSRVLIHLGIANTSQIL